MTGASHSGPLPTTVIFRGTRDVNILKGKFWSRAWHLRSGREMWETKAFLRLTDSHIRLSGLRFRSTGG
jgi:hypothetical protein